MADRAIVFLDYQNVYMSAREAFYPSPSTEPHWEGQIDPLALGELMIECSPFERALAGVRIYRGIPNATKDSKGYGACRRQISAWSRSTKTPVVTRPLRYPRTWPHHKPEEKGIDVSLAVDFVLMAVQGDYDVGILMTTDTDLTPALEAVTRIGAARVEVAAWRGTHKRLGRLRLKGRNIWCHWLGTEDYRRAQDRRDYSRP